jgi:hypothetical protein
MTKYLLPAAIETDRQFSGRNPEVTYFGSFMLFSKNKKDAGFNPASPAYCFLYMAYAISDSSGVTAVCVVLCCACCRLRVCPNIWMPFQ